MKQTIKLTNLQKDMSVIAMRNYRKTLNGLGQKLFDIAFKKVQQMNEEVKLDGMEMIYITQSLRFQGKEYAQSGNQEMAVLYREFGNRIELIRFEFQRRNNPLLKNKKAASAGTLTA
ncbi:hypothetical protein [uncultured Metabacillus sp.]|uniref:hypothetical protein n=1 Tax=uncultured Metabacillus sp. TaxID=2860135 RepID=UPI002636CAB6|nr:hypothetical protein [uncultured Metabacillus sp.]